jgi:hypothetical protein
MPLTITCDKASLAVNAKPNECPICHVSIDVRNLLFRAVRNNAYECIFQCLRDECQSHFIAYYKYAPGPGYNYFLLTCAPKKSKSKEFSAEILKVSEAFVKIYYQAAEAEAAELTEICGVGYRKALEFLIKE